MKIENWISASIDSLLTQLGVSEAQTSLLKFILIILIVLIIGGILHIIVRRVLVKSITLIAKRSKSTFDDKLVQKKFFYRLSFLIPLLVFYLIDGVLLSDFPGAQPFIEGIINFFLVLIVTWSLDAFLSAVTLHLQQSKFFKNKPINSYVQLLKTIIYIAAIIILISIIIGKSPLYLLTALGAVSAVILLIFRDTILGFTASIQIAANDMVRVGDWVSLSKYGADGDVIEINLVTVKVRNWDKTISTIPTYAFISDSFKNWRGMTESGGRRIKRNLSINMQSVKFADANLLEQLANIDLLESYIAEKQTELEAQNKSTTSGNSIVNGRRLTNLGLFRFYAEAYIKHHPEVNQDMTIMVRQLQPTELGLPLEIYCFSADKEWVAYEGIISDIFDHLIAAISTFELDIFQSPTGNDFKKLGK